VISTSRTPCARKERGSRVDGKAGSGFTETQQVDINGDVHRFFEDNLGVFHWSGSTADARAPLTIDELRKAGYASTLNDLGVKKK
jgi:hypothetical protein